MVVPSKFSFTTEINRSVVEKEKAGSVHVNYSVLGTANNGAGKKHKAAKSRQCSSFTSRIRGYQTCSVCNSSVVPLDTETS